MAIHLPIIPISESAVLHAVAEFDKLWRPEMIDVVKFKDGEIIAEYTLMNQEAIMKKGDKLAEYPCNPYEQEYSHQDQDDMEDTSITVWQLSDGAEALENTLAAFLGDTVILAAGGRGVLMVPGILHENIPGWNLESKTELGYVTAIFWDNSVYSVVIDNNLVYIHLQ